MSTFPRHGPVERYAQLRAVLDKRAFVEAFPGVGALVRLDERGGDDEPAPWAFHGSGLPLPVDVPSSDEDVFMDRTVERSALADANDSTVTGPTFSLSIPAARGRATLLVVGPAAAASVGRDKGCDICVPERSVSKLHARILVDVSAATPQFQLEDVGSTNGLAVNGRPVPARGRLPLASGDVVDLGDVSLLFLDVPALWDGLARLTDG